MNKAEIEKFQELITKNNELEQKNKELINSLLTQNVQNQNALKFDISLESDNRTLKEALKGGKISQIKLIRILTGMGLKEAKDYVESIYI